MDKVTKRTPMAGNSTLCEEFFQSHVAANVCAEDNMQQAMLITEAKSGIGSDLAHHFANQGIFSSYMEEIKKEHSASPSSWQISAVFLRADLSSSADINRLFQQVSKKAFEGRQR
jgi:NAD(P)-dependent dehydrogenase (short-subunit alcohol dehydrogenase family)